VMDRDDHRTRWGRGRGRAELLVAAAAAPARARARARVVAAAAPAVAVPVAAARARAAPAAPVALVVTAAAHRRLAVREAAHRAARASALLEIPAHVVARRPSVAVASSHRRPAPVHRRPIPDALVVPNSVLDDLRGVVPISARKGEDQKVFLGTVAAAAVGEHKGPRFSFDGSQRLASIPREEAHALRRYFDDGAVVAASRVVYY
jgi:hypothetical protein